MRRILSIFLAAAYTIADSIGVFVFISSTIGYLQGIITFFALVLITYQNEHKSIDRFFENVFTSPDYWMTHFNDFKRSSKFRILFTVVAPIFGFYYTSFVVASQLYTTYIFLKSHVMLAWLMNPLLVLIVFPASVVNYIKFFRDATKIPTLFTFYFSTIYSKKFAHNNSKYLIMWGFKILTMAASLALTFTVSNLTYQSYLYLLHHAVYLNVFEYQALINGTVFMTLMPAIWLGCMVSTFSFAGRINIVFSKWLNGEEVKPKLPTTLQTTLSLIRASAKALSIQKTTFMKTETVFFNSIISDCDDYNIPESMSLPSSNLSRKQ